MHKYINDWIGSIKESQKYNDEVCIPCFSSILIAVRYLQSTATTIRQMSCGLQPKYLAEITRQGFYLLSWEPKELWRI